MNDEANKLREGRSKQLHVYVVWAWGDVWIGGLFGKQPLLVKCKGMEAWRLPEMVVAALAHSSVN